jgi:hypothetical protein
MVLYAGSWPEQISDGIFQEFEQSGLLKFIS